MFKLMRYFSIASAVTIALAMIAVSTVVTKITTEQLMNERQVSSIALTQAFTNESWPRFRDQVVAAEGANGEQLRTSATTADLGVTLRRLVEGLTVVSVKLIALDGTTLFSPDASEIGKNQNFKAGFVAAAGGTPWTELVHLDNATGFGSSLREVDVSSSFLPVRGENGAVEAVIEIHDNVTDTLGDVAYRRYSLIATVCLLFVVLYMILQMIVGHAAKVMRRQHDELTEAKSAMETANQELADEISMRKSAQGELQKTNEQLVERSHELQQAQDSLVQKERLATLGQLTATVSHELRNPMGAIRTSLFLAKQKTEGKGLGVERALDRAERNIIRCDSIIAELLDFARDTPPNLEPTVVDLWLKQTLEEQTVPDGVEVAFDFGAPGVEVAFDSERMRRAVINVFDNGAQAMGDNPPERPSKLTVSTRAIDDHFHMIFEDQGAGMDEETLQKIFEPLFSTKSFGVGLGVPTVNKIVEVHGGELIYDSTPGVGTKTTIRLPLKTKRQEAA